MRLAPFSFIFLGTVKPECCEEIIPYNITNDNIAEPNETATISITSTSSLNIELITQTINIIIVDNDGE